jgi:hypothetical protein
LDIAIKLRLFSHLLHGGDPSAEMLYAWHIVKRSGARMQAGLATDAWKRNIDDYLAAAVALFQSMQKRGFDPENAIPIDPDGELLNGSHRVACALALGIEQAPVELMQKRVLAPAWDATWFRANGLDEVGIANLQASLTR